MSKPIPPETLTQVEELAELQFTTAEVAAILQCPPSRLDAGTMAEAYERGRLKAQAQVRKTILKMAKDGSTQAQRRFLELAERSTAPRAGNIEVGE